jgi:nitrogen fixation protein NifU and related proteins
MHDILMVATMSTGPSSTILTMYSAQLLDYFQNPRNPGDVADADASIELENPACGDILRISAKMADGRIAEIRFKAKGCVPAMACGSALTELVAGRTLEEARALTSDDLLRKLGRLPEASSHASHLAMDALTALLSKLG